MPTAVRRLAGLTALLTVCTLQAWTRPAVAAQPATRFYQGTSTDQDQNAYDTWLATNNGKTFGLVGRMDETTGTIFGARVYGTIKGNGRTTGSLFDQNNKKLGTFSGSLKNGEGSGSFTEPHSGPTGGFTVTEVTANAPAMAQLNGSFTATSPLVNLPNGSKLAVTFNKQQRTFKVLGTYNAGFFGTLTVLTINGKWIADADGNAWLLVSKTTYNRHGVLPALPFQLPKQGFVLKAGFEAAGNKITLTNALDSKALATLTRS